MTTCKSVSYRKPHVRFDEGEAALAKPRRGSLLFYKNVTNLLATAVCALMGAGMACADDADWIALSTVYSIGSGASAKYNSDQYLVGKNWNTAACWAGNVIPATTLDTVYFTNVVENGNNHGLQPIVWANNLTIAKLVGNPAHVLAANVGAVTMTIGDASEFDGVLRSMATGYDTIAGYAFSASTTVPRFAADGFPQLKVANAAHTVTAQSLYGRGTILKTGAGTLNIVDGSYQAKVRLQEGTLELPGHNYPDELVAGYQANFDASASDALVTATGTDNRTYVTRWNATGASNFCKTTNDVMRPYLRANYANGKPVVDFGAFRGAGITAPGIGESRWDELGRPAFMEVNDTLSMKSVFYVQEETSRTNNGAVAFGNRGGAIYYRMYDQLGCASPTWSGILSAYYEPRAFQYGDMRVNNMRVSHDHYEPGGFARMMVYSQAEYHPQEAYQYIHLLGSDRYYRFGGMRLGQFVSYKTILTAEEIRQNNAHLAKKWLGPVAEAVDTDVGAVFVTKSGNTISVPTDSTAVVPALVGGLTAVNGVVKAGAGTLVLDDLNLETATLTVKGGKVAFKDLVAKVAPADSAPAAEPCFWLKADAADSLVTETVNGTNFVSRWNDCRGNGRYAYVPTTFGQYSPEKPYLTANAANGKPVVDFGLHSDYTNSPGKMPGMLFNCEGSGKDYAGVNNAMEAFVMFRHKDAAAWQSWIFTSMSGAEFVNSFSATTPSTQNRILNSQYADRRTLGADWFRDGRRIDPQDCTIDSAYHVLNFATFNTLNLEALSIDRWYSYGNRGGGLEIGEYIVFDRVLTDTERRQTEAYLLKKWKGLSHPRTAARKLGTLTFADGVTPEIGNEGTTEIDEIVTTSDTLKFTGSGTVTIAKQLPASITKIDAGAVKLVLPTDSAVLRIIRGAVFNLDASRTDTMTFDANDPTRILEWRDANDGKYVAVKSHLATNTPQLTTVTINGQTKKSVCLFDWCLTPKGTSVSDYQAPTNYATGFDVRAKTATSWTVDGGFNAQEVYVVMADYDSPNKTTTHRANVYDSAPYDSPCPYRETNNDGYIVRLEYARDPNYTMRVMLDGAEVEANKQVKANRGKIVDFDYHVITLSVTNSTASIHTSTVGWTKTGGWDFIWSGKYVAEIIAFTTPLSDAERIVLHDYLRQKWQTAEVTLPVLALDEIALAGNELDYGSSVISVAKLSGSGTMNAASVALAENGALNFTFTDVDHVGAIAINGAFTLPATFTVGIAADPAALRILAGDYPLITATALTGDVGGATVLNGLAGKRFVRIVKDGNQLKARVFVPGFTLNLR